MSKVSKEEEPTLPNSLTRINAEQSYLCQSKFQSNAVSTMYTPQLSQTQTQIYSHDLIREVMAASQARSIYHQVNRIDIDTELYAKPIKHQMTRSHVQTIPPTNQLYASSGWKTIKKIQKKLQQSARETQASNTFDSKKRPSSARSKISTHNPQVSVSGLVTYAFDSVLAKNSVGFRKINHEAQMFRKKDQAQRRLQCSVQRNNRIIQKTSRRRFQQQKRIQNEIKRQFDGQTSSFLKKMVKQKEQNSTVYNQKVKNLGFIKEYMTQEKADYDYSKFIVSELNQKMRNSDISDKIEKEQTKAVAKVDQELLRNRKMPVTRTPVIIRHLYFVE